MGRLIEGDIVRERCASEIDCIRVVVLLVDHLDLWPAGLLHAIVRTSEAYCRCKLGYNDT
jgi:hypothetical protein